MALRYNGSELILHTPQRLAEVPLEAPLAPVNHTHLSVVHTHRNDFHTSWKKDMARADLVIHEAFGGWEGTRSAYRRLPSLDSLLTLGATAFGTTLGASTLGTSGKHEIWDVSRREAHDLSLHKLKDEFFTGTEAARTLVQSKDFEAAIHQKGEANNSLFEFCAIRDERGMSQIVNHTNKHIEQKPKDANETTNVLSYAGLFHVFQAVALGNKFPDSFNVSIKSLVPRIDGDLQVNLYGKYLSYQPLSRSEVIRSWAAEEVNSLLTRENFADLPGAAIVNKTNTMVDAMSDKEALETITDLVPLRNEFLTYS